MSRRSSTVASPGQVHRTRTNRHEASAARIGQSSSPAANFRISIQGEELEYDLDELFAKHTIAEVKAVQRQLRAEADAKQEELRLMVGERYRDLLQASTSIISISQSSTRVMELLREMKETILTEEPPPTPRISSVSGNDNSHLHALQLLSAHVKLLLDAPEHLWRLIERKRYFSAAWLFLLARVVHRALVREDEHDQDSWSSQGINVLEQFPLVQRQWDVVSQFRSQIIHKATLALRECATSVEDVCATLLTLHLLDSRPLAETLSVLLSQRSKAVNTVLSRSPNQSTAPPSSSPLQANGHPPENRAFDNKGRAVFRRVTVQHVRKACENALETIRSTVTSGRSIFDQPDISQRSMIGRTLEHIQSDDTESQESGSASSSELRLTTQSLLATLPSSTHFLLLPPNLKSYRPYIDMNSSSSSVPQEQCAQKLDEWFRRSLTHLEAALNRWFIDLHSVREVWSVRSSIRKWIHAASGLTDQEGGHVKSISDDVCREVIFTIWKVSLSHTEESFKERLAHAVQEGSASPNDISPPEFLFKSTPVPNLTQTARLASDASLQVFKQTLRRQLNGRTPALDEVLNTLEDCAQSLHGDISEILSGSGDDERMLCARLMEVHQPNADSLCASVLNMLDAAIDHHEGNPDHLVFIGCVANGLLSSPFLSSIHCGSDIAQEFRRRMRCLHDRTVERWRDYTVSRTLSEYRDAHPPSPAAFSIDLLSSGPSPALLNALLSLASAIQKLGTAIDLTRRTIVANRMLRHFVTGLLEPENGGRLHGSYLGIQLLWDLCFLRHLAKLWDDAEWASCIMLLDEKIVQIRTEQHLDQTIVDTQDCSEHLFRTQVLLEDLLPPPGPSILFGEKLTSLLTHGIPSTKQSQPALEIAKSSPRFGLVLVTSGVPQTANVEIS